ncbi:peptidoglycan-recognition protein LA isoform X3 [Anopheles gambiae]|uniref:peptidoglycan-recognition protein LA isoform X3 n=1 Tax=Anopheles gambiae TaxID=7165 RepID=UPI002AC9D280|nr:peptidoglycan-recognition protein LA isoform X3 [Anopheles gambiae]
MYYSRSNGEAAKPAKRLSPITRALTQNAGTLSATLVLLTSFLNQLSVTFRSRSCATVRKCGCTCDHAKDCKSYTKQGRIRDQHTKPPQTIPQPLPMENASASTTGPVPDSVANALMSIHPRYNSFHQHNAFPAAAPVGSLGARYEQNADSPGMATNHQNGLSTGNGGNTTVQPAATSVINLSNSSDVVIGPMTQYQGSVTIYQYMDATVEASRIATGRNNQNRGLPSAEPSTLRQERYFIYGALIFFAIVGFSTAIYFIVNQVRGPADIDREILFDTNYHRRTMPNLGNSHMIIERRNWGSQVDAHASIQLEHPVQYVIVTHIGLRSKNCTGMHECANRMRMLQDAAIGERNLPDIPSNFYLGGDGNVYVGRGWDIANSYHNRTLSVCFIGDFQTYEPKESQFSALHHLLTYGVIQRKLANDYKLVARRQVRE